MNKHREDGLALELHALRPENGILVRNRSYKSTVPVFFAEQGVFRPNARIDRISDVVVDILFKEPLRIVFAKGDDPVFLGVFDSNENDAAAQVVQCDNCLGDRSAKLLFKTWVVPREYGLALFPKLQDIFVFAPWIDPRLFLEPVRFATRKVEQHLDAVLGKPRENARGELVSGNGTSGRTDRRNIGHGPAFYHALARKGTTKRGGRPVTPIAARGGHRALPIFPLALRIETS